VVAVNNIGSPLVFTPLEDEEEKQEIQKEQQPTDQDVKMSKDSVIAAADYLIELGEDITDEWEIIEERAVDGHTLGEDTLNNILQLASVPPGDSRKQSEQDTTLFKIRYKYAGHPVPEREFCAKLMKAGKIYRADDLKVAENMVVNPGFGPEGADNYSIFLYKGGVNCKHWWQRLIYLRKNNKRIGVNEARRMILELDPQDRNGAKWEQNPKEVAQIAGPNNNHWRLN
jgi:hypothetical protein